MRRPDCGSSAAAPSRGHSDPPTQQGKKSERKRTIFFSAVVVVVIIIPLLRLDLFFPLSSMAVPCCCVPLFLSFFSLFFLSFRDLLRSSHPPLPSRPHSFPPVVAAAVVELQGLIETTADRVSLFLKSMAMVVEQCARFKKLGRLFTRSTESLTIGSPSSMRRHSPLTKQAER